MEEMLRKGSFLSSELPPQDLFKPIRNYRYFIMVFTAVSTLSALVLTYIYSEKYEVNKTIVFRPREVTRFSEHDTQAFGSPTPAAAYKIISSTLDDLAKSDLLLRRVVTKFHLNEANPRVYDGPFYYVWYENAKDWITDVSEDAWSILKYGRVLDKDRIADAVDTLRSDIRLRSEDSQVFTLRVRDKYPDRAVAISGEIAVQLSTLLREIQQKPATQRRAELEDLLAKKKLEVQEYRRKITELFGENQVASISEEIEKGEYRYSQLLLEDNDLQAEIRQLETTISAYNDQLTARSIDSNPSQDRLKTDEFRRLAADKTNSESKLRGLVAKQQSLQASISALKERLAKLPIIQADYEMLNNQVQRSEHDYSMINDAFQEARIGERNGLTELIIQDEPASPKSPATPIKIYHVLLSCVLGLLLSMGFAFVLDFFEVKLFSTSEVIDEAPMWADNVVARQEGDSSDGRTTIVSSEA
jgi:uncharacterized protein involved in exopolysaccharide biosynthesis